MDPAQQAYDYEALIGRNVFEPLLKPRPDLTDVQEATAASYKVLADGLTYVFHIRNTARWSDGQLVAAQDFVYAWKRLLDPRLAAPYADPFFDRTVAGAQNYSNIDPNNAAAVTEFLNGLGLSAPDDRTFVVRLQKPAGYFKWVATLWVGSPIRRDLVEKYGSNSWATVPSRIVGNGAFKLTEMVGKDHYTLVPNDFYWSGKAKLDRLIVYFISEKRIVFNQYRSGHLDVINVPLVNAALVQNDPNLKRELYVSPSLTTYWLGMNVDQSPFNNQKVREAVARAINRDDLTKFYGGGQFTPATTLIPKGMNGYLPSLGASQSFDPKAARTALQASGVSLSELNNVHFLALNSGEQPKIADFIVDQIKANLGLTWTVDAVDSATRNDRRRRGDFQITSFGWTADYPDDQDWLDLFLNGCSAINAFCPRDARYDQLVTQADQTAAQADRQKLYDQAQAIVGTNFWVGFTYSVQTWALVKPYVHGLSPTPIDEVYLPGDWFSSQIYITQH